MRRQNGQWFNPPKLFSNLNFEEIANIICRGIHDEDTYTIGAKVHEGNVTRWNSATAARILKLIHTKLAHERELFSASVESDGMILRITRLFPLERDSIGRPMRNFDKEGRYHP